MSDSTNNVQEKKPPKAKIYTRTGDKGIIHIILSFGFISRIILLLVGRTSLFSGHRVTKADGRIQALGANDELSSALGVAMEFCRLQPVLAPTVDQLIFVQRRLQELNGYLAASEARLKTGESEETIAAAIGTAFDADGNFTRRLEQWIDEMDAKLPALTSFILPSGGMASAHLHVARSVCRRAERTWVEVESASVEGGRFLNRLSDFLFTVARFACHATGNMEVPYKPTK